jgi:MFS transporter, DHA2 family, methylenomycin A resistance protein
LRPALIGGRRGRRTGRPPSASRVTLVACSLAFALVVLGTTIVNVALPGIRADLGGGTSGLQWVANGYLLLLASLLLSMGALCDVFGARRLMLVGLSLFAFGGLMGAIAPDLDMLIASQVVLGAGAAALVPTSLALLRHHYHDERAQAHAIGIWASVSAAAVASGPVIGGLLINPLGWRSVFGLDVLAAALLAWLVLGWMEETPRRASDGIDLPGQLSAIAGLAVLTFGLIKASTLSWHAPLVLASVIGGLLILAAFVAIERTSKSPMLQVELFASRAFNAGTLIWTLMTFSVYGQTFVISLYLQEQRGLSPLRTGMLFFTQPAVYAAITLFFGRMSTKASFRTLMSLGSAVTLAGTLVLLMLGAHSSYLVPIAAFVLIGIGNALVVPFVMSAVVSGSPGAQIGSVAAALNAIRSTGGLLGIAIIGGLVSHGDFISGLHEAIAVSAVAIIAMGGICLTLIPARRIAGTKVVPAVVSEP